MRNTVKILSFGYLVLVGGVACAANAPAPDDAAPRPVIDVRDMMSVSKFRDTGLSQLSDQQIKALNEWLNRNFQLRTAAGAPKPPAAPAPASMPAPAAGPAPAKAGEATFGLRDTGPDQISATLTDDFTGWKGHTRFHLDNGQVWEQTDVKFFHYTGDNPHPKVTIEQGAFSYILHVEGYNRSVHVKRIQ